MCIIIYSWDGKVGINWGVWHKKIIIRKVPHFRYFQQFWAKLFYQIWLLRDNPDNIILNFLYHGEDSLPKKFVYFNVLHSPVSQIPKRYEYIKEKLKSFKNIHFIAVSRFVKKQATPFIGNNQITVIHNGVDTDYFTYKPIVSNNTLRLITLSALEERKGIHYVINALAELGDNSIKYDVYGDGPFEKNLKEMVYSLNLGKNITIHPSSNLAKEILQDSHVYCLLSKGEAFPLGPLEAMSCGLPVLVSDYPPYDEFVNDDIGIKVSIDSLDSIINAIDRLKDIDLRRKMGFNGRKLVKEKFSWGIVAEKYFNFTSENIKRI